MIVNQIIKKEKNFYLIHIIAYAMSILDFFPSYLIIFIMFMRSECDSYRINQMINNQKINLYIVNIFRIKRIKQN